jgi:hypothetical protein
MSGCETRLVDPETGSIVGEVCHIKGEKPTAPRYDETQDNAARHGFENLILLCNVHHKIIDDVPDQYPVQRLIDMKAAHENRPHTKESVTDELSVAFASVMVTSFGNHNEVVQVQHVSGGQVAATINNYFGTVALPVQDPVNANATTTSSHDRIVRYLGSLISNTDFSQIGLHRLFPRLDSDQGIYLDRNLTISNPSAAAFAEDGLDIQPIGGIRWRQTEEDILYRINHEDRVELEITGPPGCGKSEFLRTIAVRLAQECLSHESLGRVPIFISLGSCGGGESIQNIMQAVDRISVGIPDPERLRDTDLIELAKARRLLLIVDGVDEVNQTQDRNARTDAFCTAVISPASPLQGASLIFGSRDWAAHRYARFRTYAFEALSDASLAQYVRRFFRIHEGLGRELIRHLELDIQRSPDNKNLDTDSPLARLRESLRRPLMLYLYCCQVDSLREMIVLSEKDLMERWFVQLLERRKLAGAAKEQAICELSQSIVYAPNGEISRKTAVTICQNVGVTDSEEIRTLIEGNGVVVPTGIEPDRPLRSGIRPLVEYLAGRSLVRLTTVDQQKYVDCFALDAFVPSRHEMHAWCIGSLLAESGDLKMKGLGSSVARWLRESILAGDDDLPLTLTSLLLRIASGVDATAAKAMISKEMAKRLRDRVFAWTFLNLLDSVRQLPHDLREDLASDLVFGAKASGIQSVGWGVAYILRRIGAGKWVIRKLAASLLRQSKDPKEWQSAATVIGIVDELRPEDRKLLEQRLNDCEILDKKWWDIAACFSAARTSSGVVVQCLLDTIRKSEEQLSERRLQAAELLTEYGEELEVAGRILAQGLDDLDAEDWLDRAEMLADCRGVPASVVKFFQDVLLTLSRLDDWMLATNALVRLGRVDPAVSNYLADMCTKSGDSEVRLLAAQCLVMVDPLSDIALATIVNCVLEAADGSSLHLAVRSLEYFGYLSKESCLDLTDVIVDFSGSDFDRRDCLRVLAEILERSRTVPAKFASAVRQEIEASPEVEDGLLQAALRTMAFASEDIATGTDGHAAAIFRIALEKGQIDNVSQVLRNASWTILAPNSKEIQFRGRQQMSLDRDFFDEQKFL